MYFVDYNKAADASSIQWDDDQDISKCEPFIDFIRCDNGDDYEYLYSDKNDFKVIGLDNFQAVPADDEGEGIYYLCYTADFDIDMSKHPKFESAMSNSDNLVEVVLGFKNKGEPLDCFEEYENRQSVLEKAD